MTSPRARRTAALLAFAGAVFLAFLTLSTSAEAYPWMIRHGYSTCTPCHADPSGSGLITQYGRAQGELLLRTQYGTKKGEGEQEAGKVAGFMFGAVTPPDWLLLGVSGRNMVLFSKVQGSAFNVDDYVMEADAKAQITVSRFRASGTLGFAKDGDLPAAITRNTENNLIAREFWIGVDIGEDKNWLLRGGRIQIPFGIRQIEHTLFTRMATQSDIDDTQQYGVALSYSGDKVRAELLGIAGNYNVNPDDFRQRGYAGFVELTVAERATLGISSELTHVKTDPTLGVSNTRSAHGLFTRLAPYKPLVIMAEGDALVNFPGGKAEVGVTGMLQLDYEPVQGLHFIGTGETWKDSAKGTAVQFGGWGSIDWFFLPHMDIRVDFVDQLVESTGGGTTNTFSIGPQYHLFL